MAFVRNMPSARNIPSVRNLSRAEPSFEAVAQADRVLSSLVQHHVEEYFKKARFATKEEFQYLKCIMVSVQARLHELDGQDLSAQQQAHDSSSGHAEEPKKHNLPLEPQVGQESTFNSWQAADGGGEHALLRFTEDDAVELQEEEMEITEARTRSRRLETLWEEYAAEEHNPETLFAYAMTMLAADQIGTVQAMVYVAIQFAIQIELICLLLVGVSVNLMQFNSNSHPSLAACMSYFWYDKSAENLCAAMITIFLTGLTLQREDMEHVLTFYPHGSISRGVRVSVTLARFGQCLFIPNFILFALPVCLLGCGSSFDVVMNGLAFTFISDLDTLLYQTILSPDQRRDYKAKCTDMHANHDKQDVMSYTRMHESRRSTLVWFFCIANIGVMIGNYSVILSYSQFQGAQYVSAFKDNVYMADGDSFYQIFYILSQLSLMLRPALQVTAGKLDDATFIDDTSSDATLGQRFVVGATILGKILLYGLIIMLLTFLLPLVHGIPLHLSNLRDCTFD